MHLPILYLSCSHNCVYLSVSNLITNACLQKSTKGKRFNDDKVDVSHKNIVLKNLANKIASSESLDDNEDYESDASNESTLSEGALNKSRKRSPKFVSEPNLSVLETEETPKNTKKRTRLFRSKILSSSQNLNKKYQKRNTVIRGTPTSCVSCFDEQDTGSENDLSCQKEAKIGDTPKKSKEQEIEFKMQYLTSTPGMPAEIFDDDCATPYTINFRRASMSPITKSTQKLSKAMQVCLLWHVYISMFHFVIMFLFSFLI